ncbi:MAG TPA: FAD-dependent oxidoreductase [Bryobacteraceae bacterium]|nr:FAD-dependent oxidoreductase [Bryobacteraceae bacterium]
MKARLVEWHELAPETRHFVFEAETDILPFEPGQFVSLVHNIGPDEITRAYSIASPPEGNRFALCLNLVPEGHFSPFLFGMQPGDAVDMNGPLGTFTLRQPAADSILVATGTGIAPFRSILRSYRVQESAARFTLIFGARYEAGLLYDDEWAELELERENFDYRPTLTRPGEGWAGRTGRVHDHALEVLGDRRDMDIYICGLREMVDELRGRLKALGVDRKRIVYERYD